jgi:ribosome-associated toxin RatA of RatAB toxin-antitoxin module
MRFVTLLAVLAILSAAASAGALDPKAEARLARGEVVAEIIEERGPGGRLVAAIDIPASPAIVWRVMRDCDRAATFVPGLEACRILETDPAGRFDVREHRVRWIAILPRLTLRFRSDYADEREIRVTRVGGDLARMEGAWRLEPREGGAATRLHYDFRMAPRAPAPAGLVRAGLLRDTPKVLEAVRAEALKAAGE